VGVVAAEAAAHACIESSGGLVGFRLAGLGLVAQLLIC
jgi:hypothetical protein